MTAYYNEIDPQAAQWLRNLIAAGHIAPGDVDCRSIKDVQPHELAGYTQCHFFAGIGVWSYALRAAGWPDDRPVWTGSCPCQPFSAAGKGEGLDDPRHLWPDWFRLIRERGPVVVFGEQVAGPDGVAWLDLAQADLEEHSHTVGAVVTCSAGFGGPDIRQRLYWVADAHEGRGGRDAGAIPRAEAGSQGGVRGVADGAELSGAARGLAHAEDGNGRGELEARGARSGRAGSAGGGAARWLADADGERLEGLGLQLLERGSQPAVPETAGGSEVDRVGDTFGAGLEGHRGDGDDRHEPGRVGALAAGPATAAGVPRGVADANGGHESDGGIQRGGQHRFLEAHPGPGNGGHRPGPLNGFWRAADWLFCTDGKWRPVEPGTFPLDTGIAGRLVRLRAYGNALNAEVAREFIGAYLMHSHSQFCVTKEKA